jgi:hypothetical protein
VNNIVSTCISSLVCFENFALLYSLVEAGADGAAYFFLFYSAPAMSKNFDAAPAHTLLYTKATF